MDRAIVVGINRYPTLGSDADELQGPVADATDMADWLANTNAGQAHVTLITSNGVSGPGRPQAAPWQVTDIRPGSEDIHSEFRGILREATDRRRNNASSRLGRRLYLYMAGHGFAPAERELSLITAEALQDFVPNIEGTAWIDWFAKQPYYDEFVLWMDCCAMLQPLYPGGKPLASPAVKRQDGRGKVFMAYASGTTKLAYEGPVGNGGTVRGLFTQRLLDGLRGAAADKSGAVTTESLVAYFNNQSNLVGNQRAEGVKKVEPMFPEQASMIFATVALPQYTLHVALPDGTDVTIGDQTVKVASGQVTVGLGLGLYKAVAPGGFSKLFEIAAETGTHVDLR